MSHFRPIRPVPRSGLVAMKDVVFAIFMRELKTRFGSYRLGYLWAILEPLSFVLILGYLRSLMSIEDVFGAPILAFFGLGYMSFQLFAKSLSKASAAVTANKGLFNYRQVKPIDAVIARILLELIVFVTTLAVLFAVFSWFGIHITLGDPIRVLTVMGNLLMFSFGLGLAVISAANYVKEVEKIVPLITSPLFFVSGVFFSLQDIPQQYHHYLLYNPLIHAVELTRSGFYPVYPDEGLSMAYLFAWSLGALFIGMSSYRLSQSRLVAS